MSDPATWPDQYRDYLLRFASFRLRDPQLAEDVVQETFLSALESADGQIPKDCSEKTWLTAILKHKIVDQIRSQKHQRAAGSASESEPHRGSLHAFETRAASEWEDPALALQGAEFRRMFNKCLSRLPLPMSTAFALREQRGSTTEETCTVLGVSKANLWVLLHRARARLRKCLQAHWLGQLKG